MVVLVKEAAQNAVDAGPDYLQEGVLREPAVAAVVQRVGEGPGKPDVLVESADGEQAGVAGEVAG